MAKGFGQMNQIMQQAQMMQKKMAKIQEEVALREVTGSAGGNAISCVLNGKQEVLSMKIDASLLKDSDVEMLQDLVVAAVNDGLNKSRDMMQEAMGGLGAGLNIPGLF